MTTRYINRKGDGYLETVDEFLYNTPEQKREADRCRDEYQMADPYANYYLSPRPCKNWEIQTDGKWETKT